MVHGWGGGAARRGCCTQAKMGVSAEWGRARWGSRLSGERRERLIGIGLGFSWLGFLIGWLGLDEDLLDYKYMP